MVPVYTPCRGGERHYESAGGKDEVYKLRDIGNCVTISACYFKEIDIY